MGQALKDLRDYMSLAQRLRRFAQSHPTDANHDIFSATAAALENKAQAMAGGKPLPREEMAREIALHASVNIMV